MVIRFCYDFPAPSTPFAMAYNNSFDFLLFYWKFSIKVKQTTTLYGTATPECKLIREWVFRVRKLKEHHSEQKIIASKMYI